MPLTKPSFFVIAWIVDRRAPLVMVRVDRAANDLSTDELRAAPNNGKRHLVYFLNSAWIG